MPLSAYVELVKPRLTFMVLLTTLLGVGMGHSESAWPMPLLATTLFGAALLGAGANALNQLLEKDVDAKMKRTEHRPLPSGRLGEGAVLFFGLLTSSLGILSLFILVNPLTGLLGLGTLFGYLFLYTPLKRITTLNTFVGAIPGALPCVLGFSASQGSIHFAEAWVLFAILFLWQWPHFMAISWVYREDYLRSGLRMLVLSDPHGQRTAWQIVLGCVLLLGATVLPFFLQMAGPIYLFAALLSGLLFFSFALWMTKTRMQPAKKFGQASVLYLFILIVFMLWDKIG